MLFLGLLFRGDLMIEKRMFHRVQLSSDVLLSRFDTTLKGKLENISLKGALIRLDYGVFLPRGGIYDLTVFIVGEEQPLQCTAEIVCEFFAMAGLKILSFYTDSEARLAKLMALLIAEPDMSHAEKEIINKYLVTYLHDE
jgi:hypothetical protein